MKNYTAKYKKDKNGWWVASIPEVPGCHTQGKTIEQARKRIKEALELCLGTTSFKIQEYTQ